MGNGTLIAPRFVWSYNQEDGSDGLEAVKVDRSEDIDQYGDKSTYTVHMAAPGYGRLVYRITKIDAEGIWGVVVEDTTGVFEPEDVR